MPDEYAAKLTLVFKLETVPTPSREVRAQHEHHGSWVFLTESKNLKELNIPGSSFHATERQPKKRHSTHNKRKLPYTL